MSVKFVALLLLSLTASFADYCEKAPFNTYLYCDYKASLPDRVQDLLKRLTVAEKVSQTATNATAIERLDIPAYEWWSECLHGLAHSPGIVYENNLLNATSFPQIIGLGATFNMSLVLAMAQVISTEARAFANSGQGGLSFFAPNINIYRDPRWGRGQETPGEDPYLTSQYAANFVKGIQEGSDDRRYLKAIATCKHYVAYNLENYLVLDVRRVSFNAIVSDQDLEETYFPAFRACVEDGKVGSIMCSYNAVNGVPNCANDFINNKVARDTWGFEGYIVSDCGAVFGIKHWHNYTSDNSTTVADALKGGCDLNCGHFYSMNMMEAYNNGSISEDDIDQALTRLFTYRMKLGMFDPPEMQPFRAYTAKDVNTKEHQDLALNAARESIVLLQNNDNVLPLSTSRHKTVAVIGPNANATRTMQGNYYGFAPYLISPLEGISNLGITTTYSLGCKVACNNTEGFPNAVKLVQDSKVDAVIAVIGLNYTQEGESRDRSSLALPGHQEDLLHELKKNAAPGTPFIVVVMSGGPVDITAVKKIADGILWVGYPGQSGGQAIAEVIYGRVNPSGRLPVTFYPADYINIPYLNMSMRVPPGRSYKFYTGTPVFPFGFGLSYTTFEMKWKNTMKDYYLKTTHDQDVSYEVTVTNAGKMAGSVSVLAFITSDLPGAPLKELFAFRKVFLEAGESVHLSFVAEPKVFTTVDIHGRRKIRAGAYKITIGDNGHLKHNVYISE